jgi:hypothetical protein
MAAFPVAERIGTVRGEQRRNPISLQLGCFVADQSRIPDHEVHGGPSDRALAGVRLEAAVFEPAAIGPDCLLCVVEVELDVFPRKVLQRVLHVNR